MRDEKDQAMKSKSKSIIGSCMCKAPEGAFVAGKELNIGQYGPVEDQSGMWDYAGEQGAGPADPR